MKAWGLLLAAVGLLTLLPGLILVGVVLVCVAVPRERRTRRITKLIDGLPDLRTVRPRDRYDLDANVRAYRRIMRERGSKLPEVGTVFEVAVAWVNEGERVIPTKPSHNRRPAIDTPEDMSYGLWQFWIAPEYVMGNVVSGHRTMDEQRYLDEQWRGAVNLP